LKGSPASNGAHRVWSYGRVRVWQAHGSNVTVHWHRLGKLEECDVVGHSVSVVLRMLVDSSYVAQCLMDAWARILQEVARHDFQITGSRPAADAMSGRHHPSWRYESSSAELKASCGSQTNLPLPLPISSGLSIHDLRSRDPVATCIVSPSRTRRPPGTDQGNGGTVGALRPTRGWGCRCWS